MALGGLKIYPGGYYASGGQGYNIGAPLAAFGAMAGLREQQRKEDMQSKAFADLAGTIDPEWADKFKGLSPQDRRAMLPELFKIADQKRAEQASAAAPGIFADVVTPARQRMVGATPMGALGGAGLSPQSQQDLQELIQPSRPPLQAAEAPDLNVTPPPTEQGPPLRQPGWAAPVASQLGTDRARPSEYQEGVDVPSVSEQLKRLSEAPQNIRGLLTAQVMPTILKARETEVAKKQERKDRAEIANLWLADQRPEDMKSAQVLARQFVQGTIKELPRAKIIHGPPGTTFYRETPTGGMEETGFSVPERAEKPPQITREYMDLVASGGIQDPRFTREQAQRVIDDQDNRRQKIEDRAEQRRIEAERRREEAAQGRFERGMSEWDRRNQVREDIKQAAQDHKEQQQNKKDEDRARDALFSLAQMRQLAKGIDNAGLLPPKDATAIGMWRAKKVRDLWDPTNKSLTAFRGLFGPVMVGQIDRGVYDEKGVRAMQAFKANFDMLDRLPSYDALAGEGGYFNQIEESIYNKHPNLRGAAPGRVAPTSPSYWSPR
jgi:hypothetical protein